VTRLLHQLLRCTAAAAAVEAAIVIPLFLIVTVGFVDLGAAMFQQTTVNAAAQAGVAAIIRNNRAVGGSNYQQAMNDAAGNPPGGITVPSGYPLIAACTDAFGGGCLTVKASYNFPPILLKSFFGNWVPASPPGFKLTSTVVVRLQ
jgi:TadE-like protein